MTELSWFFHTFSCGCQRSVIGRGALYLLRGVRSLFSVSPPVTNFLFRRHIKLLTISRLCRLLAFATCTVLACFVHSVFLDICLAFPHDNSHWLRRCWHLCIAFTDINLFSLILPYYLCADLLAVIIASVLPLHFIVFTNTLLLRFADLVCVLIVNTCGLRAITWHRSCDADAGSLFL